MTFSALSKKQDCSLEAGDVFKDLEGEESLLKVQA